MKLRNLVLFSDPHFGCQMGLCPPEGVVLDDGGTYTPSLFQQKVWAWWCEFWEHFVPMVTRGEPYAVANAGDNIEGIHHGAVSQITHNLTIQSRLAQAVLKPVVANCEGRYFHLRGTEAHSGASAQEEEKLAGTLGAVKNEIGQHARPDLWVEVGDALVHVMHHIGTTGSMHYETTAVQRELTEQYADAARWNRRAPDFVIRAHRHRAIEVRFPTWRGFAVGYVLPGWQGKTSFAWKIAGTRVTTPQFGGAVIRQGDEEAYLRPKVWSIDRSVTEVCDVPD